MSDALKTINKRTPAPVRWEEAYQEIRSRLQDGRLQPGDVLSLRALAREFGVSTAPVRVALHKLVAARLAEQMDDGRFRVVGASPRQREGLRILRKALECEAARLAAERITEEEAAELRRLAVEADAVMGKQIPRSSLAHTRVHLRIAQMAGCPELLEDVQDRRLMDLAASIGYSAVVTEPDSHAKLAEGIASRDPERAYREMRRHLELR
ncbi:MAG: GntR family transcriptional regulator [Planctomycetota bacterium]